MAGPATTLAVQPKVQKFAADDATFSAIPDPIPAGHHGDLLRYQPVGDPPDGLTWYRIMYLSETVAGRPTVVTGILTVPKGPTPAGGWKLATQAHGSTGLADDCAPSRSIETAPATGAELRIVGSDARAHGYVVVSTDYEGQGGPGRHPFLVGKSEGRSVLDAALAARQLPGLKLPTTVSIIGYSQGGHAALWANQLAPSWTPQLHILGTLAGAPASEVANLLVIDKDVPMADNSGAILLAAGLAAADPKLNPVLDRLLAPAGKALLKQMDASCTLPADFKVGSPLLAEDPTKTGPWEKLMAENTPGSVRTKDPVLIVHSAQDAQVPIADSATLLARMCKAGQVVERRVLPTGSHVATAVPAYADGFTWLDGLAQGKSPVSSC